MKGQATELILRVRFIVGNISHLSRDIGVADSHVVGKSDQSGLAAYSLRTMNISELPIM